MTHEVVDLFNCYLKMLSNFSGFATLNSFDLLTRYVHLRLMGSEKSFEKHFSKMI